MMEMEGNPQVTETATQLNSDEVQMDEVREVLAEVVSPAIVAEAPKQLGMAERRIYTFHKVYGTCVTYDARVFLAPEGAVFEKKIVYRDTFKVFEGFLVDSQGRTWIDGGENGGCGPRCPASLKDLYGKQWHGMPRAAREALLKELAEAAKNAASV